MKIQLNNAAGPLLVTVHQAAHLLGYTSGSTLRNCIHKGEVPLEVYDRAGTLVIRTDDLVDYIKNMNVAISQDPDGPKGLRDVRNNAKGNATPKKPQ